MSYKLSTKMDQLMVKLEDENNGEILLYYVDENGDNQQGVLTTIENIENSSLEFQDNSFILGNISDYVDESLQAQDDTKSLIWSHEDTRRLLQFYTDNKTAFISGSTQRKHLWAVACKTMLIGKNQNTCEEKLVELKSRYCEVQIFAQKGVAINWPFLDLCHQAFHDDVFVKETLSDTQKDETNETENTAVIKKEIIKTGIKQVNPKAPDASVVKMLKLYLKYKQNFEKEYWRRDLWDTIAKEMGEEDGEYLQRRFFNYKQHYILMLTKKKEGNPVNWPYMELFDKIFADNTDFHQKYFSKERNNTNEEENENEWAETELTVLAKYCFDSFDEFLDPTIPDKFLWTEVGRLFDKTPETCKEKYQELKEEHIEKYISGNYSLLNRKAVSIILDCTIAKEVRKELSKAVSYVLDPWKSPEVDELVQFFYDNIELFKDSVCHFVCWYAISKKLDRDLDSCKKQWDELSILYNSILEDKKENPDMQIDWRYIELFDRIFDYGMDAQLINGFEEKLKEDNKDSGKVAVKKLNLSNEKKDDDADYKPGPVKRQTNIEPRTDPRSTKVLEHYLKNKDKFQYSRNKLSLWDSLANEIGMNSTQCAHRLRYLRQTFMDHVQKEIKQPKTHISWPYYALCKKVFGYRTIKNKLKQGLKQFDSGTEDWLAREIKQLITFFSKNFHEITTNIDDVDKWAPLASVIRKTELNCKEKFVELRKCYRKLKTMKTRNPGVKISWSYFDMLDRIYSAKEMEPMEVETLEDQWVDEAEGDAEEDDYQCIIVLPEGQEIDDLTNAKIIVNNQEKVANDNTPQVDQFINLEHKFINKWTRRTKKLLLIHYINYVRSNKGRQISSKDMWKQIAVKLQKTPVDCRKMFIKLKNSFIKADELTKQNSPFTSLLEKVMKLKPNFIKTEKKLKTESQKNTELAPEKINMALTYYLEHIEDFVNPEFEKKYLWSQLASHISEPVTKVFNKLNNLKQDYNIDTDEVNGLKTEYNPLLKEIVTKELAVKMLDVSTKHEFNDSKSDWSEGETETLLNWYLSNLDKFKNPKFDRSYLWLEASTLLSKSPVVCSKRMSEVRTQYRNMVKQNSEELNSWRFVELCQKIYGTGKKNS